MTWVNSFEVLKRTDAPVFLAAGFFDGVHRGHQRVIEAAGAAAGAAKGGTLWVLTFETHPLQVLAPERAPLLLTSAAHKARYLEKLGVAGCLSLPFDVAWAALEPERFLDRLSDEVPQWNALFVGSNWRFGRHAAGNEALLRSWAGRKGIAVHTIPPVVWQGQVVSSTRIRNAVADGRLNDAAAMLGRPFSLMGTVERGRALGRRLGYPTANVRPDNEVRPLWGVYAVGVTLDDGSWRHGVMNWGQRPTFAVSGADADPVMEVHLLDDHRDLYGTRVEVFVVERLRDERRFENDGALARQIGADIETAERILKTDRNLRALQMTQDSIHFGPTTEKKTVKKSKHEEKKEGP